MHKYNYTNKIVYFVFQGKKNYSIPGFSKGNEEDTSSQTIIICFIHRLIFLTRCFSLTAQSIRNVIAILQAEKLFANGIGKGNSKTSGKVKS